MSVAESKKKNVITLTVVGCVIILIALAVVFFFGFFPGIKARSDFNEKIDAVAEADIEAATVLSPNAPSGIFEETEVEKVIYDVSELRELFLDAFDKVSFEERGIELSPSDYEYRIRFITDEGTLDFYVKDGSVYRSESGIRYYFAPKNAEAFDKLTNYLRSMFEAK